LFNRLKAQGVRLKKKQEDIIFFLQPSALSLLKNFSLHSSLQKYTVSFPFFVLKAAFFGK